MRLAVPCCLVLLAVLLPAPARAQCPALPCDDGSFTCRVGLVNNDEVWDADGSPYLVTGDLTVRPWASTGTSTARTLPTSGRPSTC